MAKIGDYVDKYLDLRRRKEEIEARHKEELAPIKNAMSKLEDYFASYMDREGLENLKGPSGTAYSSVLTSVTTPDKATFMEFVKERQAWYLLDVRPSKTAVEEWIEDKGAPPPGLDVKKVRKINVRKS